MIKISKKADYAVHVMASLAQRQVEHNASSVDPVLPIDPASAQDISGDWILTANEVSLPCYYEGTISGTLTGTSISFPHTSSEVITLTGTFNLGLVTMSGSWTGYGEHIRVVPYGDGGSSHESVEGRAEGLSL